LENQYGKQRDHDPSHCSAEHCYQIYRVLSRGPPGYPKDSRSSSFPGLPTLAIKCPDCRSLTVNNQAPSCFVCGRKFLRPDEIPARLLLIAGLIGIALAAVFVAAEKLLASR